MRSGWKILSLVKVPEKVRSPLIFAHIRAAGPWRPWLLQPYCRDPS